MELEYIGYSVFTIGVGVIAFFLRGIYANIQELTKSVNILNERIARYEERNSSLEVRLLRVEARLDKLTDSI